MKNLVFFALIILEFILFVGWWSVPPPPKAEVRHFRCPEVPGYITVAYVNIFGDETNCRLEKIQ